MKTALTPSKPSLQIQAAPPRFPPGPRARFPGDLILRFRRDPIALLTEMARYGDLAFMQLGGRKLYFLNHPALIQDVLVTHNKNFVKSRAVRMTKRMLGQGLLTNEGESHTRQRRLAQPAFHRDRISGYGSTMIESALKTRADWRDGAALDLHQEMMRLTLAIVGKTLFAADVERDAREIGEAMTIALGMFRRVSNPFAEILEHLPLESNRQFRRARERIDATIFRLIEEHRAKGTDQGDLLSMLLAATDEEDGTGMTNEQLRDEAVTIFLAGHEATANALTWAFYLLSQNPEAEKKLHAELDRVLGARTPSVADVPRLEYTAMVLNETLRLYPPAWVMGRQAVRDYAVGDFIAPAGSTFFMSQYVMQRDPRWFPEPERFAPERRTGEFSAALPKFAYFPFGGGPRKCIGDSFALMEGLLLTATLAQTWRMRLVPGQRVELFPQITLRPRYGMKMIFERRVPDSHAE